MLLFSDYCLFIEVPGDRGYYNHLVEVGEGAWATQSFAINLKKFKPRH